MAEMADIACPSCGGRVVTAFVVFARGKNEHDQVVDVLLVLARCGGLCWHRGDKRSIRIFIEIDQRTVVEANSNTMPILVFSKGGD